MKEYIVDLSKTEANRWRSMLTDLWAIKHANMLITETYRDHFQSPPWLQLIAKGLLSLWDAFGSITYYSDLCSWNQYINGTMHEIVFSNLSYDLYQASNRFLCSSVAMSKNNVMIHARNLDWPLRWMKQSTIIINYINGPCGNFRAVSLPGMVGITSGVAPGRFSATINLAPASEINLFRDKWISTFLLRYVFEHCWSYKDAVLFVASAKTVSPTFIQIVGIKPSEACIIETMPNSDNIVHRYKDKPLAITNHYKGLDEQEGITQEEFDWSCHRLNVLENRAHKLKVHKLSDAFKIIDTYPINNGNTTQRMVMCAKTGKCLVKT